MKTVGDLIKHLEKFPKDLPLLINAREYHSCCGNERCYCTDDYEEYEISFITLCDKQKAKKPKRFFHRGKRELPERVVISLSD